MVHFVGAGPGAPDLITRRGAALLQKADCIIYAGSLVNPALLGLAKADCAIYNSAEMTLEQVLDVMRQMEAAGKITVRLHEYDRDRATGETTPPLMKLATWTVLDLLCKLAYGLGAHGAARYLRTGKGQSWFNRFSAGLFGSAGAASLLRG